MEPVRVTVPCPCPGAPHPDGDTIGLRPKLGLVAGTLVQGAVIAEKKLAEQRGAPLDVTRATALISEQYLLQGVCEWTLVDELGAPVPVTPDTIADRLLSDFSLASPVVDKADDLYMEAVIRPLLAPASISSLPSSTDESTSASNASTPTRPKRSRRSSTSTTQTGGTATTTQSPDGDSSTSPSDRLAAP